MPNATITTGITVVFKCHIFYISISRPLYLLAFSYFLSETFLSEGTVISISKHVFSFWSFTVIPGRFALIDLSVCIVKSQRIVASLPSVTGSG